MLNIFKNSAKLCHHSAKLLNGSANRPQCYSSQANVNMNIFDRDVKRKQKERAAKE